jgi:hypothetical protein
MAEIKYKNATPVDEPVARAKSKVKSTPPSKGSLEGLSRYGTMLRRDSEELKSSPVTGLDLTKPEGDFGMGPGSYKKGGSVSSASSRADGCATKGKTRGTMITMKSGGKTC